MYLLVTASLPVADGLSQAKVRSHELDSGFPMDCTGTRLEASLANPRGALGGNWIIVDVGSIPSTGHGVTQHIPVPPRALSLCLVATCVSFSEEHP